MMLSNSVFSGQNISVRFESHIANLDARTPVGHGWSSCDVGGIMPTMFTQESAPAELRELTDLYCRDGNCTDDQKCPCDFAGLGCIEVCECKGECNNRYNERYNDTETDLDLDTDIVI